MMSGVRRITAEFTGAESVPWDDWLCAVNLEREIEMRNEGLKVAVVDGRLIISVGVDTLCHAVTVGRRYGTGNIDVTNVDAFAGEILRELEREEEDGTTPITSLLDGAAEKAIENGAEGADFIGA